jgi:hypothetical protein
MKRYALVAAAVAALLTVALPVGAQSGKSACPRRSACVWTEQTFQGRMAQVPPSGCIDQSIRSAVNTSDRTIEFFMGAGCYGPRAGTLQPGQETPEIRAGSATGDCKVGSTVDPCSDDPGPQPEPPA